MNIGVRVLTACMLLSCALVSPAPRSAAPHSATAGVTLEVRLRKLHLVRPDLIPYPLHVEVIC